MSWRLIIDDDLPGAVNMARDAAILSTVAAGRALPTVRLYGWKPPCLTLGKHQGLDAADFDFCSSNGVEIARRPTGGRALLHHLELTYSVVAPLDRSPLPTSLQDAYRLICSGLVRACRKLGVQAELTGSEVNLRLPEPTSTVPCFQIPAEGEIVVAGRKLVGSAMRAHGGCILQHGAILLDWNGALQAGAMGLVDDKMLRTGITTLTAELGRAPLRDEVEAAVVHGLTLSLEIELEGEDLLPEESDLTHILTGEFTVQTPEPRDT